MRRAASFSGEVIALAISAGYIQAAQRERLIAVDLVWLFLGLARKLKTQPHLVNHLCRSGNTWNFPLCGLRNLDANLGSAALTISERDSNFSAREPCN
jgi:hypothetical protein